MVGEAWKAEGLVTKATIIAAVWIALLVLAIWSGTRKPKPRRFPWLTRRGR